MKHQSTEGKWEKRWHPLRQEWVVYASHRNSRPWDMGEVELPEPKPDFDKKCYLCPGNSRVGGSQNPDYKGVYVFDNDHPVVGPKAPAINPNASHSDPQHLYRRGQAGALARVICYSPKHNVTLPQLALPAIAEVVDTWKQQTAELSKNDKVRCVYIFENKGEVVGVSNPHPHGQLYALDFDTKAVTQTMHAARQWKLQTGQSLFEQIINEEKKDGVRVLAENDNAIAFMPFFARFAYEVMIVPKKAHSTLTTFSDTEINDFAALLQEVTRRYDLLFNMSFPYILAVHQAPTAEIHNKDYRTHVSLLPPLRQPKLQKFLAGPETGADTFMADTMPEEKAAELKNLNLLSYTADISKRG